MIVIHLLCSLTGWRNRVKSALCPVVISSLRVVDSDTGMKIMFSSVQNISLTKN